MILRWAAIICIALCGILMISKPYHCQVPTLAGDYDSSEVRTPFSAAVRGLYDKRCFGQLEKVERGWKPPVAAILHQRAAVVFDGIYRVLAFLVPLGVFLLVWMPVDAYRRKMRQSRGDNP